MDQNTKKIYDVRLNEQDRMTIIGTSPNVAGQAVFFDLTGKNEPSTNGERRVYGTLNEHDTGFDDRAFLSKLVEFAVSHFAPNYPDDANKSYFTGSKYNFDFAKPLDWTELSQWADFFDVELTNVPTVDVERMTRKYDTGRAFQFEFMSGDNGDYLHLDGTSLETLNMQVELKYAVKDDAIYFYKIFDNKAKSVGPRLIPLSWVLMGMVVAHVTKDEGEQTRLVVVDESLISGDMDPGQLVRLLGISEYYPQSGIPEEGNYVIDPRLIELGNEALRKLEFKLSPVKVEPTA
ncbi:hypothetical protein [Xanthomonas phage RTH11]|nr:hypothetical protein [Xanthomonas phage RTH11]